MKLTNPLHVFIRSYFVIVAAILIIALALDSLLVYLVRDDALSSNISQYSDSFELIEILLDSTNPDQQTEMLFSEFQQKLSQTVNADIALYTRNDFNAEPEFLRELETGEIISVLDSNGGEILFRNINESSFVLAIGPLQVNADNNILETIVISSYYLLIAIIIFLWVRPIFRDLTALRLAASQFGRDDFSSRVSVSDKSTILPVAESFNTMAARIQYLVSAHRELTNAVSHELRTPLSRFKFSLEMISKTQDTEKKQRYLASIKDDVAELENLIDEMLSYAKLSEENLLLHQYRINLKHWLMQQLAQYQDNPITVQVGFNPDTLDDDMQAHFNSDLMARALHNVMRNCLRYANQTISLSVQLTSTQVSIRICDDGPGIPAGMGDKIFEPFSRMDTSRDRNSGGYGLGLAIANRIMQRHRGSIRFENCAPNGACFILQWPRKSD